MTPRYVPPAAAPLRMRDMVRWARRAVVPRDPAAELHEILRERLGVRRTFLTCTGRAGMTILLRALSQLGGRDRLEVVLPSYTCYSVAASIVKAGLRPRIVDITPETLDYDQRDLDRVDFTRVLAIVATNLYGMPNDLPAITATARRHGVFVVDDAAQALGASVGGRLCGTWGDAGLFSFDKGKNVAAIDGGVVVTSAAEVAAALDREIATLPAPGRWHDATGVAKALGYFALLRPSLYWLPNRVPQLGLGKTVFTTDFPLERAGRPLVALAATMMRRLDEFTSARRATAAALISGLRQVPGIRLIRPIAGAAPVYLRLPMLVVDETARRRLLDALTQAGIGATASYPASIADIPALRGVTSRSSTEPAGGRHVAHRIVTLPTHPFMRRADVQRTLDIIGALLPAPACHAAETATCVPGFGG